MFVLETFREPPADRSFHQDHGRYNGLCNAMGGYGDSLCAAVCAIPADRSKQITNKEGKNRQEREDREEDHHPPRAELRISLENLAFGKNSSSVRNPVFGLRLLEFGCPICVDRPLWKLFVCTYVEPPDVFPAHIVETPWCLAKALQPARLFQWI